MRISDWSSDVCSSDLADSPLAGCLRQGRVLASSEQGRGAATPRSTIAAPLIVAGEPLGALAAVADRNDAFGAPEEELLRSVAATEIGSGSCRERVCQSVEISVVAVSVTKNRTIEYTTY